MNAATATPADVFRRVQDGTQVDIIDVRTPAEFASLHAEGARVVPLDALDPHEIMRARNGSAEPLYVICQSGARGAQAVRKFRSAGFDHVVNIEGGTAAWQRAGLPVVRGPRTVMSLERQVRIAAGVLVLAGSVLGWHVHPAFHGLSAFVGAGLLFAGVSNWCGMGLLLAKLPWNQTP
jgi:rhodanese-related sulfurtransferase